MFGRKAKKEKNCTRKSKTNVEASSEATKACSTKGCSSTKSKASK